ncbi:MAG: sigma-70 family RNA polymerase sigma factor [Clostridiales bacterium]|nr:sigma-70 family RNA polymerase sigma factor [Clostridiales bacterium]
MNEELRQQINQLIAWIARGNEAALNELARLVSARMLSIARAVVHDRALAEDVVQESFIKIVNKAHRFKQNTNGYAWLCKIVHNTALNALRTNKHNADIDEFYDIAATADVAEQSTAALSVSQAMSVLTEQEKLLIYQKYFMDFTVRDSAKATGLSKSTVSRKIAEAEEKMRKFMTSAGQ